MKETLHKHIQAVKQLLEDKEVYKFTFNLAELPPHNNFNLNITKHERFKELFSKLDGMTTFCIYWFECEDQNKADDLISILNAKRDKLVSDKGEHWRVPPYNGKQDSKVIYLGVRQGGFRKGDKLSNISGRIVQHLGYYEKEKTASLHFLQWASNQDYNVTINVVEIGIPIEVQYLYIIEKLTSIALKPICGKH